MPKGKTMQQDLKNQDKNSNGIIVKRCLILTCETNIEAYDVSEEDCYIRLWKLPVSIAFNIVGVVNQNAPIWWYTKNAVVNNGKRGYSP